MNKSTKNTVAEATEEVPKKYGTIKKANYFSEIVGDCTIKDDETGVKTKLRLEIGAISRSPIVMNEDNGKSLVLSGEDLVNMAIDYVILKDEVTGEIKDERS